MSLNPKITEHLISASKTVAAAMLFTLASQLIAHQEAFTSLSVTKDLLSSITLAVVRVGIAVAIPVVVDNMKAVASWLSPSDEG